MTKIVFKRVEADANGFKIIGGLNTSFEECEKIIIEQSEQGYSYKGFIPIEQLADGRITKIDLVFEKESDK